MVCGTTSDAGKSHVVTGLCRLLSRQGIKVAPFKAQNMALNSFVTASGHEIGRAQAVQAMAAGLEPEVGMNPILLKPTGERTSQVVVRGEVLGHLSAAEYHEYKPKLLRGVLDSLQDLRDRFDVVIVEGAGSPTEINLLDNDIVNLRIASEARLPAVVVGDIDRGGVFAALYGTVELLPDHYRSLVRGFIINKFLGDPELLGDGLNMLEDRCKVPTLGVLPWLNDIALDAEDSFSLAGRRPRPATQSVGDVLDIAVVQLPRISNFTDLDPLAIEPGVAVRFVDSAGSLGAPDLVVIPGTKATVLDLQWLRSRGLNQALDRCRKSGTVVLGICGGFQILGQKIIDSIESDLGDANGLGFFDVETRFHPDKITRQRSGTAFGKGIHGYEIHHGRISVTQHDSGGSPWLFLDDSYGVEPEGIISKDEMLLGTTIHGLFEADEFRETFLRYVARHRAKSYFPVGISFADARDDQFNRLADLIEGNLDMDALNNIVTLGISK